MELELQLALSVIGLVCVCVYVWWGYDRLQPLWLFLKTVFYYYMTIGNKIATVHKFSGGIDCELQLQFWLMKPRTC